MYRGGRSSVFLVPVVHLRGFSGGGVAPLSAMDITINIVFWELTTGGGNYSWGARVRCLALLGVRYFKRGGARTLLPTPGAGLFDVIVIFSGPDFVGINGVIIIDRFIGRILMLASLITEGGHHILESRHCFDHVRFMTLFLRDVAGTNRIT